MIPTIMQFFEYGHLPSKLQDISREFKVLADFIVAHTPLNAEQTTALRKLLEAKDCAVRSALTRLDYDSID